MILKSRCKPSAQGADKRQGGYESEDAILSRHHPPRPLTNVKTGILAVFYAGLAKARSSGLPRVGFVSGRVRLGVARNGPV